MRIGKKKAGAWRRRSAAAALLAGAASAGCVPVSRGDAVGGGEPANGPPAAYPVVLRGEAPEYREEVSIEEVGTGAGLVEVLRRYRFGGRETADFIRGRADRGGRWWLVVPPYQPTGGHRLRVAFDGGSAGACLVRPRGPATMALKKNAWLVALPRHAGRPVWRERCG